ncbi:DUF1269 domain-containing protein [Diaminobutyricibacter tongyongensis]|uniref:DUF1269 domain-containing protein n=1 Tax=Leifsonia tongyongensis TaxID=1268043 RepID=A0A6L9Y0C1_9MICO|nr:DUF1269 domain-containing protein [Diaminobutyricibacter tongyongensis]NEN06734.1 DUF1269 domain-containing protein [Diaminobutyricibacter tongyongensis]
MSTLIILSFDKEAEATAAFDKVLELHRIALMRLADAAWIAVGKDGHIELKTAPHDPAAPLDATEGAAFGQILGALVTAPIEGFAVGGTIGAIFKAMETSDDTVDEDIRKQITKALRPGAWAVVAYATQVALGEIRRQFSESDGSLIAVELDGTAQADLARDGGIEV